MDYTNLFASVLMPATAMRAVVKGADRIRACNGRRRAFRSASDAAAYERGYSDGADLAIGDASLLHIHCPYSTGYYDAIEDADHRAFGS